MPRFCMSVKNTGGAVLFGASEDGLSNYFHYGAPGQPDLGQNPGFVTLDGLLSNIYAVPTMVQMPSRSFLMALVGHSDANVYIGTSSDATNWSTEKTGWVTEFTPSLLIAGNYLLYLVDGSNNIGVYQSDDGKSWLGPNKIGQQTRAAPCVVQAPYAGGPPGYPNYGYIMAFVSNDSANNLLVCTSQDGWSWSQSPSVGQQSAMAPSITFTPPDYPYPFQPTQNSMAWIAFVATDGTNEILLSSSSDGYNWGSLLRTGHHTRAAPALSFVNGQLFLMFLGNDPSKPSIFACTSSDGVSWTEREICPGIAAPTVGGCGPPFFEAPVLKS
jgi:hypothetical protein